MVFLSGIRTIVVDYYPQFRNVIFPDRKKNSTKNSIFLDLGIQFLTFRTMALLVRCVTDFLETRSSDSNICPPHYGGSCEGARNKKKWQSRTRTE